MKKMKLSVAAFVALLGVALVTPMYATAAPADQIRTGVNQVGGGGQATLETSITDIINVMLFVIGALAVIMIIVGGIRYVISAGDSSKITAAKNTIMYAVVGLVVAILAYALVNFVIDAFI